MEYAIKYISTMSNGNYSHYDINGYDIKFNTKSTKEVLSYVQNMENILENNFKFNLLQDLDSDIFRAIEYFSQACPELVKSYFLASKEKLILELENMKMRRFVSITGIMKNICDIPITEVIKEEIKRIYTNITYNMPSTKKILNDLFRKRNDTIKITTNKNFSTPFGVLKCLGNPYGSNSYLWELNGNTGVVFKKSDKDIDELTVIIIKMLSEIHSKVTRNVVDGLVDLMDIDEIKMLSLYTKAHVILIGKYIEKIIQNNINDGKLLYNVGNVNGFSGFDIFVTLSTNKSIEELKVRYGNKTSIVLRKIISKLTKQYLIKQVNYRIDNNSFDISKDDWIYYYKVQGKLKYKNFDFSQLKNCSAKREFKLYLKQLIEVDSQTKNTIREDKHRDYKLSLYILIRASLNYFIIEHSINCFADITTSMVTEFLSDLEFNGLHGNVKKSAQNIESCIYSIKYFSKWIYKNANKVKTQKPERNVFESVIFTGSEFVFQEQEDTKVIPEFVMNQIIRNLDFLKPVIYKRLLLCCLNTPRRFAELQLLYVNRVHPLISKGEAVNDKFGNQVYILSFIEPKKQKNKQIINGLNYSEFPKHIPISHIVAREIEEQTKESKELEKGINEQRPNGQNVKIDKVFVLQNDAMRDGYSLVSTMSFVDAVNRFIMACNITDENGTYWKFTSKQTRTTGTNLMVELGFNLDSIQKMLGHEQGNTTYKSYIKLSHLKIAGSNTKFIRSQFDSVFLEKDDKFDEYEIVALFNKYCLDYNKIYYNRKLLGVCGLRMDEKCPKAEEGMKIDSKDELPCANCSSLYVGESCKSGWQSICANCKSDIDVLEGFFKENNISLQDAIKVREYKSVNLNYMKSRKVLESISNLGGLNE